MLKSIMVDTLKVNVYETRDMMGKAAAEDVAKCIKFLLSSKEEINMIFAAAPSQNEVLKHLLENREIEWSRINAFHMDEYIGINKNAPQSFANFLDNAIFSKVPFKTVNKINCEADAENECKRYSSLLKDFPVDIVCMGIGENGHIAFNDPPVANFNDSELVKIVELDEICRNQQVHDGCFKTLSDVPKFALTLTVPALMNAEYCFCVVPASTKANAVKNTLNSEINEHCPATILRKHSNAIMYCDSESGKYI